MTHPQPGRDELGRFTRDDTTTAEAIKALAHALRHHLDGEDDKARPWLDLAMANALMIDAGERPATEAADGAPHPG